MSDVSNLRDTIVPKSDQLNAEQLLAGPMTITVTGVDRGTDEQPVVLHHASDPDRPYKPGKSMRKVLIFAWGEDGREWVGRSMTLYCDPEVMFGGVKVGGIRISHLSHIERDIQLSLTATKGKKKPFVIRRLEIADPLVEFRKRLEDAAARGVEALRAAWESTPKSVQQQLGRDYLDGLKAKAAPPAPEPAPATDPAPATAPAASTGGDVF